MTTRKVWIATESLLKQKLREEMFGRRESSDGGNLPADKYSDKNPWTEKYLSGEIFRPTEKMFRLKYFQRKSLRENKSSDKKCLNFRNFSRISSSKFSSASVAKNRKVRNED